MALEDHRLFTESLILINISRILIVIITQYAILNSNFINIKDLVCSFINFFPNIEYDYNYPPRFFKHPTFKYL
jgi:hypothetical protein